MSLTHSLLFASPWLDSTLWMLVVAMLISTACALVGGFLVLRRVSLMGDAISHAVLPGLVIAFIITGKLDSGVMLLGALIVGLLTTWLIQVLQLSSRISPDAIMGVVFTSLFALGIVLLKATVKGQVDLDVECVLYGSLTNVWAFTDNVFGYEIPRAAITAGAIVLLNFVVILLLWKELKLSSFDPAFAESLGKRPKLMHYILMTLTAMTTVASFEAVGSILVIAMLIVPGATAHLLTDRLKWYVLVSVLVGLLSAVIGIVLGHETALENAEPAALIAVCAGSIYLLAVFFAPRYGLFSMWLERARQTLRIVCEDLLAMLYRLEELAPQKHLDTAQMMQAQHGGLAVRVAMWQLQRRGQLALSSQGWSLTDRGRTQAATLVRSHRLWEAWLVKHLNLPLDHVHAPAERMEHYIGGKITEQLTADVGDSQLDPHGRNIPAVSE